MKRTKTSWRRLMIRRKNNRLKRKRQADKPYNDTDEIFYCIIFAVLFLVMLMISKDQILQLFNMK